MAVLSVVTYAVLFRILKESEMGNWVFYQFAFILLDSCRTGFLQTALIKFYAGSDDKLKSEVAGSAWYIALIITGLLAIPNIPALFAGDYIHDQGIWLFIKWYSINLFLTLPFNFALWILQAEQRFDQILVLRLITQGSFIILIFIFYLLNRIDIEMVIYLSLASALLASVVSIILGWSRIRSLGSRTKASTSKLYHFGKFGVGSYLCSTLFKSSDAFFIKFMIGPAALAVYNLPQRLMEIVEIPLRSFMATAMPEMSAAFNQGKKAEVMHIMKKYAGVLTLCLIPLIIGMVLFADVFVSIIGGPKYANSEAANVFRIFMVCSILYPIERFPGITLDIIHKPQLNLLKVIYSLIVNVVTDIIAIKLFGNIYGVAIASVFTLLFGVAFGFFSLKKFLPFNLSGILRSGYDELKILTAGFIKARL